jgi:hypothetical protein
VKSACNISDVEDVVIRPRDSTLMCDRPESNLLGIGVPSEKFHGSQGDVRWDAEYSVDPCRCLCTQHQFNRQSLFGNFARRSKGCKIPGSEICRLCMSSPVSCMREQKTSPTIVSISIGRATNNCRGLSATPDEESFLRRSNPELRFLALLSILQ